MRLLVFFDLPVKSELERSRAAKFRRELMKMGFYMVQYSIYSRICRGEAGVNKYATKVRRLVRFTVNGHIRMMPITEKQFERMEILIGTPKLEEKMGTKELLLF